MINVAHSPLAQYGYYLCMTNVVGQTSNATECAGSRFLRAETQSPIPAASRSTSTDMQQGLEAGADENYWVLKMAYLMYVCPCYTYSLARPLSEWLSDV